MENNFKKLGVVIVPSLNSSYITKLHGKLYLNDKPHGTDTINHPINIYLVSDDEIDGKMISRGTAVYCKDSDAFFKVEATTDARLSTHVRSGIYPKDIKWIIDEYNKGHQLNEINGEQVWYNYGGFNKPDNYNWKIKTSPDNMIIINHDCFVEPVK